MSLGGKREEGERRDGANEGRVGGGRWKERKEGRGKEGKERRSKGRKEQRKKGRRERGDIKGRMDGEKERL